jgi:phosphatidylglycerophosphate synthase
MDSKDVLKAKIEQMEENVLHPNQLTLFGFLMAVFAFPLSFLSPWLSILLFALALIIDAMDGWYARQMKRTSSVGAFLDGISDRLVEILLILSVWFQPIPSLWIDTKLLLLTIAFFGSCLTSYVKAYAISKKVIPSHILKDKGDKAIPTLFSRKYRAAALFFALVFAFINTQWSYSLLFLSSVLAIITVIHTIAYIIVLSRRR